MVKTEDGGFAGENGECTDISPPELFRYHIPPRSNHLYPALVKNYESSAHTLCEFDIMCCHEHGGRQRSKDPDELFLTPGIKAC